MESEVRTDSFDYRTELLSPAIAAENISMAKQPSWRISMDEHRLPERHMDSHFGFGVFLTTLSTILFCTPYFSYILLLIY